jgi:hypothetical protein
MMKSSLALTMGDIAEGRISKDSIFSHRVNHREVKVDGAYIDQDEIFVIQSMKSAEFNEASTTHAASTAEEQKQIGVVLQPTAQQADYQHCSDLATSKQGLPSHTSGRKNGGLCT